MGEHGGKPPYPLIKIKKELVQLHYAPAFLFCFGFFFYILTNIFHLAIEYFAKPIERASSYYHIFSQMMKLGFIDMIIFYQGIL